MLKTIIILFFSLSSSFAVIAQDNPGGELSRRMAQKIKDTLLLSDALQEQLYSINIQLHQQKMEMRRQYSGNDSLGYYIQKVESMRDSLYRQVLKPEQYQLYKEKKRNLISNK